MLSTEKDAMNKIILQVLMVVLLGSLEFVMSR